jgi:hypothetical protein
MTHREQDMLREERILLRRSSHWLEAHAADEKDTETSVAACGPRPATTDIRRRSDLLAGNRGMTVETEDSERALEQLNRYSHSGMRLWRRHACWRSRSFKE